MDIGERIKQTVITQNAMRDLRCVKCLEMVSQDTTLLVGRGWKAEITAAKIVYHWALPCVTIAVCGAEVSK